MFSRVSQVSVTDLLYPDYMLKHKFCVYCKNSISQSGSGVVIGQKLCVSLKAGREVCKCITAAAAAAVVPPHLAVTPLFTHLAWRTATALSRPRNTNLVLLKNQSSVCMKLYSRIVEGLGWRYSSPPVNVQFKFIFVDKDFVSRCAVKQFVSYSLVHCRLRM